MSNQCMRKFYNKYFSSVKYSAPKNRNKNINHGLTSGTHSRHKMEDDEESCHHWHPAHPCTRRSHVDGHVGSQALLALAGPVSTLITPALSSGRHVTEFRPVIARHYIRLCRPSSQRFHFSHTHRAKDFIVSMCVCVGVVLSFFSCRP